jgi:hypothetical protein
MAKMKKRSPTNINYTILQTPDNPYVDSTGFMTKAGYMKFHSDCCARMVEITKAKNADYSGGSPDPLQTSIR